MVSSRDSDADKGELVMRACNLIFINDRVSP